jgi:hypothetical protein
VGIIAEWPVGGWAESPGGARTDYNQHVGFDRSWSFLSLQEFEEIKKLYG